MVPLEQAAQAVAAMQVQTEVLTQVVAAEEIMSAPQIAQVKAAQASYS